MGLEGIVFVNTTNKASDSYVYLQVVLCVHVVTICVSWVSPNVCIP